MEGTYVVWSRDRQTDDLGRDRRSMDKDESSRPEKSFDHHIYRGDKK